LCKESATAGDVRAAMPHPVAGSAADPIALEPVDDVVVTTLVDNVYDALLTATTPSPERRWQPEPPKRPSSSRGLPTSG
jgi:hypothetical protein